MGSAGGGVSKSRRRVQASKRREPDLSALRAQFTVRRECRTGLPSYPRSLATTLTEKGGNLVECPICDWYHVVD